MKLIDFIVNNIYPFQNLNSGQLSDLYGSDKNYKHGYTKHYEIFLKNIKHKKITLLEIGIGRYEDSRIRGSSLRMWEKYFSNGMINGIDII